MIEDMDKTMSDLRDLLSSTATNAINAILTARVVTPDQVTPEERTRLTQAMGETVTNGLRSGKACVEILQRIHTGDLTPEQLFLATDIVEIMHANLTLPTSELLKREEGR